MAFLFKSKKNVDKAQAAKDGANPVAGSQTSLPSTGGRGIEKSGPAQQSSSTPQGSVNNSMNSLQGGTNTPSPEQVNPRRGPPPAANAEPASDLPVSGSGERRTALRIGAVGALLLTFCLVTKHDGAARLDE